MTPPRLNLIVAFVSLLLAVPARSGETPTGLFGPDGRTPLGVRALVVGVDRFEAQPALAPLPRAASDARRVAEDLHALINPTRVVTLAGPEASAQRLRRELQTVLGQAGPEEVVFLYLNTRSLTLGGAGYLLATDSLELDRLPYTALPVQELSDAIARSRAAQIVLLVDLSPTDTGADPTGIDALLDGLSTRRPNVWLLSAEQAERADGPCPELGLLACGLSVALHGAADLNQDAQIGLDEIAEALPGALREAGSAGLQVRSEGQLRGKMGFTRPPEPLPAARSFPQTAWEPAPDSVLVCFSANGEPVRADHVFHTGDQLSLKLNIPRRGHVYVLNVGPDGAESLLFPLQSMGAPLDIGSTRVDGGQTLEFMPPDHPDPIVFSDPPGPEHLYAVFSEAPLADFGTLARLARERAAGTIDAKAWAHAAPDANSFAALSRVDDVGEAHCSRLTPRGNADAWVIELVLDHR